MPETAAMVLCGGRSSRMGRAKAWLPWRGRTMIEHVVGVLRESVDEVVVVTSASLELPKLGVPVLRDEQPELGPLGGLAVGLAAVSAPLCFATGTDAPHLGVDFVRAVLAAGRPAAPVVDGHVQTLAAAYPSANAGAEKARALLAEGVRRPLALLEAFGYLALTEDALPGLEALRGFNTPGEYLAAIAADANSGEQRDGSLRKTSGTCKDGTVTVGMAREGVRQLGVDLEFVGRPRLLAGCDLIRTPIGSLGEVLAHAPAGLELCVGERVAPGFLVSLGGRDFVRDARIPVGPGERVVVLDAAAGG